MFDLHLHSEWSDGRHSIPQVIGFCKQFGIRTVSITDHDTLSHIPCLLEQAAMCDDITAVPGIELTLRYGDIDVHTLGYGINWQDSDLANEVVRLQTQRKSRFGWILGTLRSEGYTIEPGKFREYRDGDDHIVRSIFSQPNNAAALKENGVRSPGEFVNRYLCPGGIAYAPRSLMQFGLGTRLVREAGGVAIVAHPVRTFRGSSKDLLFYHLTSLLELGANGVETGYSTHSLQDTLDLHQFAEAHRILETAGSDFHELDDGSAAAQPGSFELFGLMLNLPDFS